MLVGGVTPFGLPEAVPVLVDAAVMERPSIVLGGGGRRRAVESLLASRSDTVRWDAASRSGDRDGIKLKVEGGRR
jgi:prolyl-tRNA editing enzyme YbaK/EbsC (Cys-tRNA(Pro) deacylase)